MAEPIPAPPPGAHEVTGDPVRDELDELAAALHDAGALRLLTALVGQFPEVMGVLLRRVDTPQGRDTLQGLAVLGTAAGRLDPELARAVVDGAGRGVAAASERLAGDPPGALALARRLRDPDVRRGLDAVLALLGEVGASGRRPGRGGA